MSDQPILDHWRFSREDLALLRRAARSDWSVPDCLKNEAIFQAGRILTDPESTPRDRASAGRLLAAYDRTDQAAAKLALEQAKAAKPEAPDARDALLLEALEITRGITGGPGGDSGDPPVVP